MEEHSALFVPEKAIWDAESKMRRGERREGNTLQVLQVRKKRRSENEYFLLDMAVFD